MRRFTPSVLLALVALTGCALLRGRSAPLADTYWRLVELGGRPTMGGPGPQEAHLQFARDSARVTGFTGCNRLSGRYTLDGSSLRFGATATTRMACADPGGNRQEQEFLAALGGTTSHRIAGDTLVLVGVSNVLARLVATRR